MQLQSELNEQKVYLSEHTVSNLRILKRNGVELIKQACLLAVANLAKYWLEILTLQICIGTKKFQAGADEAGIWQLARR